MSTSIEGIRYHARRVSNGWVVRSSNGWYIGRLLDGDIRTLRKRTALRGFIRSRTR